MPRPGTSMGSIATIFLAATIVTATFVGASYIESRANPKATEHTTSRSSSFTTAYTTTPTTSTTTLSTSSISITSSSYTSTTPSSTTMSTASSQGPSNCLGYTQVPQRPVGNRTPVLLMQPNTVGYVCVTWRAAWADDPSIFDYIVSGWESQVYFKNGLFPFHMSIGGNNAASSAFNITATPSSVRPSANVTSVTVLYRVSAATNSKGFYDYSAPYGYCGSVPMAVGYSASQVNGSDFPPRPPPHSCIASPYSPVSVGVTGIGVLLVDIPPSRLYLIASAGSTSYCSETGPDYNGHTPCFTYDRANATVFNCQTTAATPSGCTVSFGSGANGYSVTVWYPAYNQSIPWANCAYITSNASGLTSKSYEDCLPVSSNSFIIAAYPGPLT